MPKTISQRIMNAEPGREWAHKTIYEDGSETITYGPTPDPKDATDLGSKSSAAKPESKPKSEPKAKPTVNSAIKNATKPATKPLSKLDLVPNMGEGIVSRIKSKFTDSPLIPRNIILANRGRAGFGNLFTAANAYSMGSGGGYMPVGEGSVDIMRVENHPEDLSSFGTEVPINDEGTVYINPDTGVTNTDIKIGSNGEEYYRVSPDKSLYKPVYGSGEAIEEDALNSLKDTHISADQLARNNIAKAKIANFNKTADYLNDIISGVIKHIPQDISKLPPLSTDTPKVANTPVVRTIKPAPRAVVQNTSSSNITPSVQTPVTNASTPVATPTLSSVVPQAVRHNGGFDNYRRESVLSALRAAGGISPAEAVQRGIIPWEALNYV